MNGEHASDARYMRTGLEARLKWVLERSTFVMFQGHDMPTVHTDGGDPDRVVLEWENIKSVRKSRDSPHEIVLVVDGVDEGGQEREVPVREIFLEDLAKIVDAAEDALFKSTAANLITTVREWTLPTHDQAIDKLARALRRTFLPKVVRYVTEDNEDA